jgi:hypothetical protein
MVAHEGLLHCGTDQHYLISYDLTRDALFGGPRIVPDPDDRTVYTKFLLSTQNKLFAWCEDSVGSGAGSADGFYRLPTVSGDFADPPTDVTDYEFVVETSDFAPEPDREKKWSELKVMTRRATPATAGVTAEYSIDGGANWSSLSGTQVVTGAFTYDTFDLSAVSTSKVIRFRFTAAKGTSLNYTELCSFTCTFLQLDPGRRTWTMTVAGTEKIELANAAREKYTQDISALDQQLWDWWEDKTTLDFTDLDGVVRTVMIADINDAKPIVGPKVDGDYREGFYTIVLAEI